VTRRLRLVWPDPRPFRDRDRRPIRLLAASDEPDPTLEVAANRDALGPIDAIVGCGDLEPYWLSFLGDAFCVPIGHVAGNHDRGAAWEARSVEQIPRALPGGSITRLAGLPMAALPWPGAGEHGNIRNESLAWRHSLTLARRRLGVRSEPLLVISHVPPAGAGDAPDAYHEGFRAYRWLLDRLQPPLWLHGHVTTASVPDLRVDVGRTTLVNVTGSVLIELEPPAGTA